MSLETIMNIYMLFSAGIGMFLCLYHFVETPKRIWTYATLFFLAHFLSDYYWTIYVLIMNEDPGTSAMMAYFGWNMTYICVFLMLRLLQKKEEKSCFSIGMLLPIPLNIAQFILYIPYGGIINNTWQGVSCTVCACISLQGLLYYLKNRKNGATFPVFSLMAFLFITSEYGMWTSSCFTFENQYLDPYYYFSFIGFTVILLYPWAIQRSLAGNDDDSSENTHISSQFRTVFQVVVALIICGCCMGGYLVAGKMRDWLNMQPQETINESIYNKIAIMLFIVSIIMVLTILLLMFGVFQYFKHKNRVKRRKMSLEEDSISCLPSPSPLS